MRLLLAEDNRELAHWLEKALVQNGFAVDCVFDGLAADHLLHSEMYALAVLDINMPGMDGLEVVQRLRKRGQTLPVLLLTARSAVADRVKGLNVGADDYLPKPFELEELDARLRALLRRSAGGTVAKLAMRQPFVLFKGLTFQKLCLPGAFRPGDHHNKMLRPG
ncbi:response regulator, partial [Salmonella enterica]|uniref:response regulator n=1 Tax=Salmonella enterica TaxID=28901 RepID=UPI00398C2F1B